MLRAGRAFGIGRVEPANEGPGVICTRERGCGGGDPFASPRRSFAEGRAFGASVGRKGVGGTERSARSGCATATAAPVSG